MNKNKLTIIILSLFLYSCNQQRYIAVNKDYTSCEDYFIISTKIEKDSYFRSILSKYLYSSLVGGTCYFKDNHIYCTVSNTELVNDTILNKLFERESFVEIVSSFFIDKRIEELDIFYETIFGQHERWVDSYNQLLYNCNSQDALYKITDILLEYHINNGLFALWNNCDITQLKNLEKYIQRISKSQQHEMADIVILLHNNKYFKERDFYFNQYPFDEDTKTKLLRVFSITNFIDLQDYKMLIYDDCSFSEIGL